jgi:hypothetical protein
MIASYTPLPFLKISQRRTPKAQTSLSTVYLLCRMDSAQGKKTTEFGRKSGDSIGDTEDHQKLKETGEREGLLKR